MLFENITEDNAAIVAVANPGWALRIAQKFPNSIPTIAKELPEIAVELARQHPEYAATIVKDNPKLAIPVAKVTLNRVENIIEVISPLNALALALAKPEYILEIVESTKSKEPLVAVILAVIYPEHAEEIIKLIPGWAKIILAIIPEEFKHFKLES